MTDRIIYLNGSYLPESEARISVYDEGSMYGTTVFEMLRSFNGQHFKMDEHLDRLYEGLKFLRIPEPMSKEQLREVCDEVTLKNCHAFAPDDEFRLMINVSRGPLSIYQRCFPQKGPTVCVTCFPLRWTVAGMGKLYETGVNAVIVSQRHTDCAPNIKHRSRMHLQLANQEAAQAKGENNWALLLDEQNYIAEGAGANILLADDDVLYVPYNDHALKGISKRYVVDLAYEMDMHVSFERYNVHELMTSKEAFFTGTPFGILPITSVNGIPLGDGKPGPMFKRLMDRWSDNVRVDIPGQIKKWDAAGVEVGSSPYVFKA